MHTRHTAVAICGGTLALMAVMGGVSFAQGTPLRADLLSFDPSLVSHPEDSRARNIDHTQVFHPDISRLPTVKSASSAGASSSSVSSAASVPTITTPECDAVRNALGQVLLLEDDILPTHADNADRRLQFETRLSQIITRHCGGASDSSSSPRARGRSTVRCDRLMKDGIETQESFHCRVQIQKSAAH
jgi:hypothetical protein